MRLLFVQVPQGKGKDVLDTARKHGGVNLVQVEGREGGEAYDLVIAHVPNGKVEGFMDAIQEVDNLRATLIPRGVLPLRPPASEAPEQVRQVEPRSPIEVFLDGIQSVGSWRAFIGYAVASGAIVWIGLTTSTVYLLTAAMLIAPFAGPAMNAAIATARGDLHLLGRSVARYGAGLFVSAVVAFLLNLALGPCVLTSLMIEQSQVSGTAVLLPLIAGAAGALNLTQSERSSLVSGAATGMLVAASLAPPVGLFGIAASLGQWHIAKASLFVVLLQLAGINLAGTVVFRLYGLTSHGARYSKGKRPTFAVSSAVTALGLGLLLWWQFSSTPELRRSSRAQHAVEIMQDAVQNSGLARYVQADAHYARSTSGSRNTLLGEVYVERQTGNVPADSIRATVTRAIQEQLLASGFNAVPLIQVTVLDPPAQPGAGD